MARPLIQIHNAETGEDIVREMNDAEYADWQAGQVARDAAQKQTVCNQRNTKLSESDWTQVADAPVDKAAWATYRQELRDISKQAGFPWEITWPVAP